jgi:hypothetical protein
MQVWYGACGICPCAKAERYSASTRCAPFTADKLVVFTEDRQGLHR